MFVLWLETNEKWSAQQQQRQTKNKNKQNKQLSKHKANTKQTQSKPKQTNLSTLALAMIIVVSAIAILISLIECDSCWCSQFTRTQHLIVHSDSVVCSSCDAHHRRKVMNHIVVLKVNNNGVWCVCICLCSQRMLV